MKIAIITGASSGLGAEFVLQMGAFPDIEEFWLIARRKEKLEALAKMMSHHTHASFRVMPYDLCEEESIKSIEETLNMEKPEITWLINCAGFGKMGANTDLKRETLDQMVLLNDKAAMDMTTISLPYMAKDAHILEIASTAAFMPLPYLGVYGATKAFLLSYSRSLNVELKDVTVTAVCPYWIKDTEFIKVAQSQADASVVTRFPYASTSPYVVKHALKDALKKKDVSTPTLGSRIHRPLAKVLPHRLLMYLWDKSRK